MMWALDVCAYVHRGREISVCVCVCFLISPSEDVECIMYHPDNPKFGVGCSEKRQCLMIYGNALVPIRWGQLRFKCEQRKNG